MVNYHRTDQRARSIHALQLRIEGHTWQSICDQTDWKTEAGVRKAVGALLDRWESETADEYRTVQDQRYLALLRAWWPAAVGTAHDEDGDLMPPDDKAAAIVLRVMDSINKLHGLNREGPGADGPRMTPDEFRASLAEYVALQQQLPPAALEPGGRR
ncbi:hypothetical protein NDR87_26500 [Nocardia sp. CDC159]|uniref:Uncharacterized protein n=1 Tax=Nocardia pulmonis TaxID=2951408 RepID=A0A9X2IXU1_9NOCA|nr:MULTISPECIES: hypothetical protein [Nocardia]MCM6774999.1 hypothetical protein [Nocardia pulmonis]MCM6789930.1 hypothetical protein [Nocardia sp. CDC159]